MFLPHPRVKVSIVGSLRDREVACSASDRQGSNFESCVWRTVSSQSSHHPQGVLLAQFSLYVHKGGLKPDSFHFIIQDGCQMYFFIYKLNYVTFVISVLNYIFFVCCVIFFSNFENQDKGNCFKMAAKFTSKYHSLSQLWISLAGLNYIAVKLCILLAPRIPFSSGKWHRENSFAHKSDLFQWYGYQIILLYMHQIMFVNVLNLFVLVRIHSSRHLIRIHLATMYFGQLLPFSWLWRYFDGHSNNCYWMGLKRV